METSKFNRYCSAIIYYTLLVILWGAWVRISGSGDGCGESWPLCHEQLIPKTSQKSTWIEFSHRLSSGFYGFLTLGQLIWASRLFKKSHPAFIAAILTFIFTITEALLGARLVLAGLVGDNASLARAYTMALHLINSMLLMASAIGCYHFSLRQQNFSFHKPKRKIIIFSLIAIGLFLFIGSTGALAALSTTLFPSQSLSAGLLQDLAKDSHIFVKLRILHPLSAISFGAIIIFIGYQLKSTNEKDALLQKRTSQLIILTFLGLGVGLATLLSLSPTPLKIIHLAWAYGIWNFLILSIAQTFYPLKEENP